MRGCASRGDRDEGDRVAVADQAAYEAFYMNKLAELPGLARVNSQFTMKMVKRDGVVPI